VTVLSLLVAFATVLPSGVEDYFPLQPGATWSYVEEGPAQSLSYVDTVLEATEVGGEPAIPVESRVAGKLDQTRYYRVIGDTVYLVAYDPKKPLKAPQPVLKAADRKVTWDFKGLVPFFKDDVPLEFKASAAPKGRKKVLGEERECLELVLDAKMLGGPEMVIEIRQQALYAKGVGLVEMKQRQTIKGKATESTIRLTSFEIGS
jgi:hypothetical protein